MRILLILLVLLIPVVAGAAEVAVTWTAPTSGGPVVDYVVEVQQDGGAWVQMATTTATMVRIELPLYVTAIARVAGRNPAGQGPWSALSEPYYVTQGAPGEPGNVHIGPPATKPQPQRTIAPKQK